jgi:hypothetical protein
LGKVVQAAGWGHTCCLCHLAPPGYFFKGKLRYFLSDEENEIFPSTESKELQPQSKKPRQKEDDDKLRPVRDGENAGRCPKFPALNLTEQETWMVTAGPASNAT